MIAIKNRIYKLFYGSRVLFFQIKIKEYLFFKVRQIFTFIDMSKVVY